MDSLDPLKVKKNVRGSSETKMDVIDEIMVPSDNKTEAAKIYDCGQSMQFSTLSCNSNMTRSFMLPLVPIPKVEDWCSNTSIVLTGTACRGVVGPPVGVVDIGVSISAYYFCITLPGVMKDPGKFSIEIQQDGIVCVKGITSTGRRNVTKYSRVFEMKYQQQCPPGPFTLSFNLPGPVDPRLFSPTFRSDGVLEGVVAKYEESQLS
ncbi:increased DNA methylation 3-like [Henckelia pumila]|uniref:increased DNA methylation 3-like n=1 Tax=Henckelia pumila TaxID=405737 RepID=UPI003C6E5980